MADRDLPPGGWEGGKDRGRQRQRERRLTGGGLRLSAVKANQPREM